MKLKELLEIMAKDKRCYSITFTIAKVYKDERTPFYHFEYYQTPIRAYDEWKNMSKEYIVVNPNVCPIDMTGLWQKRYLRGEIYNAIICTEEDLIKMYGEKQGNEMIEWYDKDVRERLER